MTIVLDAFIADQFYQNVKGLDSCCITAFGSAKFIVRNTGKVDSVWISVGIPIYIAQAIEEAIYNTATYWRINKKHDSISFVIPLFIAPSNLCKSDNIKDKVLDSAADMFTYHGNSLQHVGRNNYYRKAKGTETGVILSPLLIKGRLNDKFIDIFQTK